MPTERRNSGADRRAANLGAGVERRVAGPDRRGRLGVRKTYKMYVGGAFVRSESGRSVEARGLGGAGPAGDNVCLASRKDARDAVLAAQGALAGWSGRTAYNRGQIVYRLAEVMEARARELTDVVVRETGASVADARVEVEAAIDRAVAWAGWTDKYQSLLSSQNPVAGPLFCFSHPEPVGVVASVLPARPALLGMVSCLLPVIVGANVVVALAPIATARVASTFAECLATSDVPAGVLNLLTGEASEVGPHLAKHLEVDALDLWLAPDEEGVALAKGLEVAAAEGVKRVRRRWLEPERWFDARATEGPGWIDAFVETKTLWQPVGL